MYVRERMRSTFAKIHAFGAWFVRFLPGVVRFDFPNAKSNHYYMLLYGYIMSFEKQSGLHIVFNMIQQHTPRKLDPGFPPFEPHRLIFQRHRPPRCVRLSVRKTAGIDVRVRQIKLTRSIRSMFDDKFIERTHLVVDVWIKH